MEERAESAVIIRVAEADARVDALRQRYEPAVRFGVPAHFTLLYPFTPPRQITQDVLQTLREVLLGVEAFDYRLHDVRRFPGVVYLAPEPHEPFVELIRSIERGFPGMRLYRGRFPDVVPHLTVGRGDEPRMDEAYVELRSTMAERGPIHARCSSVEVMENSLGLWRRHSVLALGRATLSKALVP
jgi:2'-5' RNA ligase